MEEQTENKPIKKKLYIPLILTPDNKIYDIGISCGRDYAEFDLQQTWDRLKAEDKDKFRKVIKEVEIEL